MFRLKILVVAAVEQEIGQIRYYGLCTFRLQKIHNVVVGSRQELDQDLSHDADPGFFLVGHWQIVEVADDLTAHLLVFPV